MEHSKTSRKLSETIKQAKKVSQVGGDGKSSKGPSYSATTKTEHFLMKKRLYIKKKKKKKKKQK